LAVLFKQCREKDRPCEAADAPVLNGLALQLPRRLELPLAPIAQLFPLRGKNN